VALPVAVGPATDPDFGSGGDSAESSAVGAGPRAARWRWPETTSARLPVTVSQTRKIAQASFHPKVNSKRNLSSPSQDISISVQS